MKYLFVFTLFIFGCTKEEIPEKCVIVKTSTGYVTQDVPDDNMESKVVFIDNQMYYVVFTSRTNTCTTMTENKITEINNKFEESLNTEGLVYWHNYANKTEVMMDDDCSC